ncbi:hypothetical protein [Mucilaginibacter sp.]|jgi:hypothetical protein|uniref:hypothetical protein n=1 Tax=Mucilaginibacter sp. TaxID=1882438 RepID=UPI0035628048
MIKIFKYMIISAMCLVLMSLTPVIKNPKPGCKYYTFVWYGKAHLTSNVRATENVYKEFNIIKTKPGYMAAFNDYRSVSNGEQKIINIGPFDTESVCYTEKRRIITDLENKGYKPREQYKHMMPAILEFDYQECN